MNNNSFTIHYILWSNSRHSRFELRPFLHFPPGSLVQTRLRLGTQWIEIAAESALYHTIGHCRLVPSSNGDRSRRVSISLAYPCGYLRVRMCVYTCVCVLAVWGVCLSVRVSGVVVVRVSASVCGVV